MCRSGVGGGEGGLRVERGASPGFTGSPRLGLVDHRRKGIRHIFLFQQSRLFSEQRVFKGHVHESSGGRPVRNVVAPIHKHTEPGEL